MLTSSLQKSYAKYKSDEQIFHDLIQHRIRKVLLVATIYDSYILEQEGLLGEKVFNEYYQLNLSNVPRIISVTCGDDALEKMHTKKYDMVILTMRIGEMTPFELSGEIKAINPDIPILLLINDHTEISYFQDLEAKLRHIDRVFSWNSEAKTFLAMTKYIEDKLNVPNDTEIGMVRVILLVEDSIKYYSRYLPILYTEIILQTQKLITQEFDDSKKLLRMKGRPKVLIASTYEKALDIVNKYKDFLLCVISDVRFPKDGVLNDTAGFQLVEYVKNNIVDVPALLQSSDPENKVKAQDLKADFIDKNSETLSTELRDFMLRNLGFGDFHFRDQKGLTKYCARNMWEFERILKIVTPNSLLYHSERQHFSAWLMARGEIRIAKKLRNMKFEQFKTVEEVRKYLIKICEDVHYQNTRGKVVDFDEKYIHKTGRTLRMRGGSIGGKGRGLAFLNTLLYRMDIKIPENAHVKIPQTVVIGIDEFEDFIEQKDLKNLLQTAECRMRTLTQECNDNIKWEFLRHSLSESLIEKLRLYLRNVSVPLAVRSSGAYEDSISHPFSGIYETFILPNNNDDLEVRLEQLMTAVKLIFAGVFSKSAKAYFEAIDYTTDEEKMAVVIQEVAGARFGDRFYPHISGVAQSFNFYPYSGCKQDDGIASIALGLGKYVVGGERSYTFSPKHPKKDLFTIESLLNHSQRHFYALNMTKEVDLTKGEDATLEKLDIEVAEKDGALNYIASIWDAQNNRLQAGVHSVGARIINFAHVLKYNYFRLDVILNELLKLISYAMGTPVEIEFACDLDKKIFYLLQIKPLIRHLKKVILILKKLIKMSLYWYLKNVLGMAT